jgi:hypothetical protein
MRLAGNGSAMSRETAITAKNNLGCRDPLFFH